MRGPCPCVLNRINVIRIHFQLRTLEGGHPFLCLWTIHWHCWGGFWSPVFWSPSLLTSLLTQQWYSPYVIDISMVGCLCSWDKENGNRWYRCKGFDWIKDNNFFVLTVYVTFPLFTETWFLQAALMVETFKSTSSFLIVTSTPWEDMLFYRLQDSSR